MDTAKIRIDFGRVFPGIILLLVGLALLVVLGLVAVVAFLFSFVPGSGSVLGAALGVTAVPALLVVAGVITIITGVSWWRGGGWLFGVARARALEDRMRPSARAGEVFGVAISIIVFFFLYENQMRGVAFFTPGFGLQSEVYFYGPLLTGIVLSLARAAYGHRNGIRPLDALNALFLVVAAFGLLAAFPFEFARFGDMFPTSIQPVFSWLNNDVGRVLFALAGVGASISFVYTTVLYLAVKHQLYAMRSPSSAFPRPAPAC